MIKKPVFFITTPIFYCNSELHLGHLYSSFYADFLSRFYKNEGYKVYFLTGVDQHGQKIFKKTKELQIEPQKFVDNQTKKILELWKEAELSFTHFVKTTDKNHEDFVKNIFKKLIEKKKVILKNYVGKYCVFCESFEKKNIQENKCPRCQNKLITTFEKNYFFIFNKIEITKIKILIEEYKQKNPDIKFLNQLDEFIESEKIDFSISRNKLEWGITLNEEEKQKAYVWFDALLSYVSIFSKTEMEEIWYNLKSKIVQVLGKEIIKFHLIYWLVLLNFQNLKMPDYFLIHGWILNKDSKMSKSIGNTIPALYFLKKYDTDVARLYLSKLMNPQLDISFSISEFEEFYSSHVVKNLSNYHFRLLSMIKKFDISFENIEKIKEKFKDNLFSFELDIKKIIKKFKDNFYKYKIAKSSDSIFELLDYGNKKITLEEPWNLFKNKKIEKLKINLYFLLVILKITSDFLESISPNIAKKIKEDLNEIENLNEVYIINLKISKNFKVKLIKHLYEK